ncbi:DUF4135 domain-containing protein, partial [Streptomyces sp. CBMA156]|uniref:DUF4135 domain-containing protein n=1 Tax=Streptomyces sp. CBMA156 TaxID=1930280 RepID=UPI001661F642
MVRNRSSRSTGLHAFLEGGLLGAGDDPWPRIASIDGAAGTGKTTLLCELTEHAAERGSTVVGAVASPAEQSLPYEVLEQLRQGLPGDGGPRPRWPDSDGPVPPQVLEEVRREFTGPAAGRRVLITVDDAQFADRHSLRCLLHLVRHSPAGALAVILTRGDRAGGPESPLDELLADEDVLTVRLDPLTVEEVAGVLTEQLPVAEARRLAPVLHEAGGGNPLLVKALLADHLTHQAPGETFRQAALRCIHRSGDEALATARGLALLGGADGTPHLGALVGLDDPRARDAVAALRVAGILKGSRFRHEAVLSAVLDDLPAEEGTRLRRRAAELLHHGGADPMRVADQLLGLDHTERPADQDWVYRVLQEAAHRALVRDDIPYAMRCLQLAERHCPNEAARLAVKSVLAHLTWSMRPAAAPQQLRSLTEPACDGLLPPDYTLRLVTQLMWYGHLDDAAAVFRGISSCLDEDDGAPRLDAELQATRLLMAATYPGALDGAGQPPSACQDPDPVTDPVTGRVPDRAPDTSGLTAFRELTSVLVPTCGPGPGSVSDAEQVLQSTRLTDHSLEPLRAALLTLVLHDRLDAAARACDRLLGQVSGEHAPTTLAVLTAMRGLISLRRGRLTEAANLALCHELQSVTGRPRATDWDAAGGLDASREGWLARLERLPGLAHLVGTACRQWQHTHTELFARLAADRALLVERMWQGEDPGALDSLRGEAGDRHAGGRSVALLHFAGGRSVVYKPKDMRHATAYLGLVERLNRELSLDLPLRTVLLRSDRGDDGHAASLTGAAEEDYGWEELVPHRPCADRSGFARFYRRLGMTVRLVQLLEGRDLWADNLLADGEHPALIDLECLLYPRVQPPPAVRPEQHGLLDDLESTVVRTAMAFQSWTPARGRTTLDIGCLSRLGSLEVAPGVPALPLPPYRPVLATDDGGTETADPWQYTDEVVAGYREMHAALCRIREELAHPEGPLAGFRGIWVRYIWRHTWDGYKILRASTSPLALDSGATRETVLAGALHGTTPVLAEVPGRTDLAEVVLAEIEAFRELDIPFFRSLTTSSSVFTADGREIPGHFLGTGWQRLGDRVAELAGFDLEGQVAVLTGCLDAARTGTDREREPSRAVRASVPSNGELLDHAVRIGDAVLAERRGTGWLGQSWYPGTGLRQVEVLGPNRPRPPPHWPRTGYTPCSPCAHHCVSRPCGTC